MGVEGLGGECCGGWGLRGGHLVSETKKKCKSCCHIFKILIIASTNAA